MKLTQLHTRDLLWIVLVVALMLDWCLDHRRLAPYEPALLKLTKTFTSVVETLQDEGISTYVDSTTHEVSLETTGMGKQRWDAHSARVDQETAVLPELEITTPSLSASR